MHATAHIAAIEAAGDALLAAAAATSLDAPVPSCPDWDLRELVRHQGGIHRWATNIVATPRTEYWDAEWPEIIGGDWPSDSALLPWFESGYRALVGALRAAPDDLACWTFLAAPSPKAMWARRQAHETTVHRVDAELAAGNGVSPIAADLAADGIDELLSCFITRGGGKLRAESPRTLAVDCADADDRWVVEIGPPGATAVRGDDAADCTVTGPAADLYLALWNRGNGGSLDVAGDRSVLDLFLDRVHIRWS